MKYIRIYSSDNDLVEGLPEKFKLRDMGNGLLLIEFGGWGRQKKFIMKRLSERYFPGTVVEMGCEESGKRVVYKHVSDKVLRVVYWSRDLEYESEVMFS
jgi:hypothetical protein